MRSRIAPMVAALAVAVPLAFVTPAVADPTPRGIHIAFGEDPTTSATVVWHTVGSTPRASVVEYGPTESLGAQMTGSSVMAPGLAPAVASRIHEAALTGLEPGATVHYRVGDGTTWSPVRAFRTAPTATDSFEFVAFGDHGTSPQAQVTNAFVDGLDPAFVVIAGDVSYANSDLGKWDLWSEQVQPLAAQVPVMAAPGNHDTATSETPTPEAFLRRFAYPDAELFYSFDFGRVHFLMLHSTVTSTPTAQYVARQIAFAEQDLAAASQRKQAGELDFIVVVQHHPLYASQATVIGSQLTERNYNPPLIAWEERLLHLYDVDVLIAGHNHHYERTTPMMYGRGTTDETTSYEDPTGFVEVITGGGGAGLYDIKPDDQVQPWSVSRAKRFHVVRFVVDGRTLRAESLATDGKDPAVIDTWTLARG